jgi:hypothetical protein
MKSAGYTGVEKRGKITALGRPLDWQKLPVKRIRGRRSQGRGSCSNQFTTPKNNHRADDSEHGDTG